MSDANSAKRETWESVKRAGFADWVREDKDFQRLLALLTENFGAIEVAKPDDSVTFPWIKEEILNKKGGRR